MDYQKKRIYSRTASLVSYWGLVTYLWFSPWFFPIANAQPWLIAAIKTLPLLLFAPAVIKQNRRGLVWLCFTLLIYFTFTIAMWQTQSWFTIALITTLFTSAVLHIRWHNRALHGAPARR